jgi:dolichol-phosphate mannosyltransferase
VWTARALSCVSHWRIEHSMACPVRPLVIIPTYNERDNIIQLIQAVLRMDSRLHILVVDDGSPDGTAAEVSRMGRGPSPRVFLQTRSGKLGLGSAYVHGFKWGLDGGYDFLIQMDADWSHPPKYLERMLQLARQSDFVVGSRYVPGGGTQNWGVGRKFISKSASLYARLILGVDFADFTGGFNGWSDFVLRGIDLDNLRSDGYSFQIELKYLAHQSGFKHIEFPITFNERRAGNSKMSLAIALEASWRIWQLRLLWHGAGWQTGAQPATLPPLARQTDVQRNDPAWIGDIPE